MVHAVLFLSMLAGCFFLLLASSIFSTVVTTQLHSSTLYPGTGEVVSAYKLSLAATVISWLAFLLLSATGVLSILSALHTVTVHEDFKNKDITDGDLETLQEAHTALRSTLTSKRIVSTLLVILLFLILASLFLYIFVVSKASQFPRDSKVAASRNMSVMTLCLSVLQFLLLLVAVFGYSDLLTEHRSHLSKVISLTEA